jgi:hypothetical protein
MVNVANVSIEIMYVKLECEITVMFMIIIRTMFYHDHNMQKEELRFESSYVLFTH